MNLGIDGKWALVCASSQGLGRACAEALAGEGVNLVVNGRDRDRVESAAREIGQLFPVQVIAVVADITTADGKAAFLGACPSPDILVTNNAGPTPGAFHDVSEDDFARALAAHFFTPISLVRSVVNGMQERKFGRIVNITSAMVTTPNPVMAASSGARTGMTAVMKGLSRTVASDNVTINQLLPERIDSGRQQQMAHVEMERHGITFEQARERQAASIAAGRLGRLDEFGAACAFLCGVQASYISGVNLHLDGGSYAGLV